MVSQYQLFPPPEGRRIAGHTIPTANHFGFSSQSGARGASVDVSSYRAAAYALFDERLPRIPRTSAPSHDLAGAS
jgi:hypothetical protein